MAHRVVEYANADRGVLGRDASAFLPIVSYLNKCNPGSQHHNSCVLQLWHTFCSRSRIACLCDTSVTGEWFPALGGINPVFNSSARTTMVRELLAGHQTVCCHSSAGRGRTIRAGYGRGVVATKRAEFAVE